MSFLVVAIIDDVELCPYILAEWEKLGVLGVTILESTGLGRIRKAGLLDDIPLMPSLQDLLNKGEVHHRTMLSVVESQDLVDKMAASVQNLCGDLEEPNTGFLFVVPVIQVYGKGDLRVDRNKE